MKGSNLILLGVLVAAGLCSLASGSPSALQKVKLGDNAALRYWAAFAQMQDEAITKEQVKELGGIFDGTAPYDDQKFKDLVAKNKAAIDTMVRGTALANCDWGLEIEIGPDAPMDYAPKAVALGRLNALYAFHLLSVGDNDGAVHTLVAGLRFSRDIAIGGTMLPTLLAEVSLIAHLKTITFAFDKAGLNVQERWTLAKALADLGSEPLDWGGAMKRETDILGVLPWPAASPSLRSLVQAYQNTLKNPANLPKLQTMIASVPQPFQGLIINPTRTLKNKQELDDQLRAVRSRLQ